MPQTTVATALHTAIDPAVYALIAAAVTSMMGPRSRVRSVTIPDAHGSIGFQMFQWSLEGRRQIFASHRPR